MLHHPNDIRTWARSSVINAARLISLKPGSRKEIIVDAALRGLLEPQEATELLRRRRLVHS